MTYLNPHSEALFKDAKPHWTKRMTIETDLIERLEKADGPDRELDAAIHCAFNSDYTTHRSSRQGYVILDAGNETDNRQRARSDFISKHHKPAPNYTSSTDDALTLKGGDWFIDTLSEVNSWPKPRFSIELWKPPINDDPEGHVKAAHNDLAIALCIAALKARSQS